MMKVLATKDRDNCAICGNKTGPEGYAIVVGAERLCLSRCFGWFSGYPWVLFEMGRLTSDLRNYDLEVQ